MATTGPDRPGAMPGRGRPSTILPCCTKESRGRAFPPAMAKGRAPGLSACRAPDEPAAQHALAIVEHARLPGAGKRRRVQTDLGAVRGGTHRWRLRRLARPQLHPAAQAVPAARTSQFTSPQPHRIGARIARPHDHAPACPARSPPPPAAGRRSMRGDAQPLRLPHRVARDARRGGRAPRPSSVDDVAGRQRASGRAAPPHRHSRPRARSRCPGCPACPPPAARAAPPSRAPRACPACRRAGTAQKRKLRARGGEQEPALVARRVGGAMQLRARPARRPGARSGRWPARSAPRSRASAVRSGNFTVWLQRTQGTGVSPRGIGCRRNPRSRRGRNRVLGVDHVMRDAELVGHAARRRGCPGRRSRRPSARSPRHGRKAASVTPMTSCPASASSAGDRRSCPRRPTWRPRRAWRRQPFSRLRVPAGSRTTSPSSASVMTIWQPSREVFGQAEGQIQHVLLVLGRRVELLNQAGSTMTWQVEQASEPSHAPSISTSCGARSPAPTGRPARPLRCACRRAR